MKVDICFFVGCPDYTLFVEVFPEGTVTDEFLRERAEQHHKENPEVWPSQCYFETKEIIQPTN
jgi:hypothetical protein